MCEPSELLVIDVPEEFVGIVMEKLGYRKAELINMAAGAQGYTRLEFKIPSRGLIGYRGEFMTDTKGNGIMNSIFDGYKPFQGDITMRYPGSLVASESGEATSYGLYNAQDRGVMFIGVQTPVYEGMLVGECPKQEDIAVNVCKKKHLTSIRSSGADEALRLVPPKVFSLEQCLEFLADDATRADPAFLAKAVKTAIAAGASTVTVCDTAGSMLPAEFANAEVAE